MKAGDSVGVTLLAVTATATAASSSSDGVSTSDCIRGTGSSCSTDQASTTRVAIATSGCSATAAVGLLETPEVERSRPTRVHPAAMALRLRVTQVVCGILTCVLGTVALIEERGELRLSSGLVAGAATVLASVASIYATFDTAGSGGGGGGSGTIYYDRARWITYHQHGSTSIDTDRTSCVLSTLWGLAVITNLAMLAFAFMVFQASSSTRNLIVIGSLELGFGATVLAILGVNLCLALHYKEQLMRKN